VGQLILGIIGTALGILGVYGFFTYNGLFVLIGGIAGLIGNLIGIVSGQQKSLATAIIASVIGAGYAAASGMPIWFGVLIGLSFESAITGILGYALFAIAAKNME